MIKKKEFSFLRGGISLKKMDDIRECFESISNQKLSISVGMLVDYAELFLKSELNLLSKEMTNRTLISLFFILIHAKEIHSMWLRVL